MSIITLSVGANTALILNGRMLMSYEPDVHPASQEDVLHGLAYNLTDTLGLEHIECEIPYYEDCSWDDLVPACMALHPLESANNKRIGIVVNGGNVTHVFSDDKDIRACRACVIDFDTDGACETELTALTSSHGEVDYANVNEITIDESDYFILDDAF